MLVLLLKSAAVAAGLSAAITVAIGIRSPLSELDSEAQYGWRSGSSMSNALQDVDEALQAGQSPIGESPVWGWRDSSITEKNGRPAVEIVDATGHLLYRSPSVPVAPGWDGPVSVRWPGPAMQNPNGGPVLTEWAGSTVDGSGGAFLASCKEFDASQWRFGLGVLPSVDPSNTDRVARVCVFRTEAQVRTGQMYVWRAYLPGFAIVAGAGASILTPLLFGGVLAVEGFRSRLRRAASSDVPALMENPRPNSLLGGLTSDVNQSLARARMSVEQQRGFVADAAHELRSPLATLITTLEVAERHPHLVDPVQVNRTSLTQARRLERLTQDLLLLAQLDARTPLRQDEVDLADVVREVAADSNDPGRPITLDIPGSVPAVGDRDAFRRIVQNLVDNAVRHAATGVEVALVSDGRTATVSVTNDGSAIPEDRAERIFERFTRLDDARNRGAGGTGLGLAIARGLAERYDGSLDLERGRRRGASFTWQVPVAR